MCVCVRECGAGARAGAREGAGGGDRRSVGRGKRVGLGGRGTRKKQKKWEGKKKSERNEKTNHAVTK